MAVITGVTITTLLTFNRLKVCVPTVMDGVM